MANPEMDKIETEKEAIKVMFGIDEKSIAEEEAKKNDDKKNEMRKEGQEERKEVKDEKPQPEKKDGDTKKEEQAADKKDETIDKKEDKYSFIPEKFRVNSDDGSIDIEKTLEKVAKSYTHLESFSSRKNTENEKLRKEIEAIKQSQPHRELAEDEDEIIKKLYDNPKEFLSKMKEDWKNQYESEINRQKSSETEKNEKFVSEVQDWIDTNGAHDIAEDMAKIFSELPQAEQQEFASGSIPVMMKYLKAQVEISKMQKASKYKPTPPKEESAGVASPRIPAAVKPKLDNTEKFLGEMFGLSEEEVAKIQNK